MKNTFLILALTCIHFTGYGQAEPLDFKVALKMYNLTSLRYETMSTFITGSQEVVTTTTLQVFHPTVAIHWKGAKANFHEIELTDFSLDKISTKSELLDPNGNVLASSIGADVKSTNLTMRYEFISNLSFSKAVKLIPGIGFSASPYFRQANYLPQANIEFPAFERKIGAGLFLIPRLSYHLSSKLFLDLNFPVYIADIHLLTTRSENPVVPVQRRTISTLDFAAIPKHFSFRIGIGVKL